ncbi:MAG: Na+/H+ antiporter NhaA [Parvularculaceae bacterium]|nr:Na+/H+ antiporter NhaA [Parvularculaceae bacterium]
MEQIAERIKKFIELESAGGIALGFAALLAFVLSNSPLNPFYDGLLGVRFGFEAGALSVNKPLSLWINDGLMAIFFFLVGLEIKREVLQGELSTVRQAMLPIFAAAGGVIAPALIYVAINQNGGAALSGWAIPAATDIAFSVAVLGMLGARAPASLKIFLLAVAIIDDLAAIVIIALFYTSDLSTQALMFAGVASVALFALNRAQVTHMAPYVIVGAILWVCVLKSGVHATLAGVITALAVPLFGKKPLADSPLHGAIHALHPWVAFGVLPIFAFANAGVSLSGVSLQSFVSPVPLGIALGLIIGKPVGVLAAAAIAVRTRIATLPADLTWRQIAGAACLCGIGFTMSLFIGTLAFDAATRMDEVKLGVLAGSAVSGLLGYAVLRSIGERAPASRRRIGRRPQLDQDLR